MSIRCKLGFHKFSMREIHVCGEISEKHFPSCIIERCECGVSRFAPFGSKVKTTCIVIPSKYALPVQKPGVTK